MNVVINGVEYVPRYSGKDPAGKIKPVWRLMADARRHKGWTLKEAAAKSLTCMSVVHAAECGLVSLRATFRLAEAYDIPLELIADALLRRV